jgi:hypothetical protein
MITAEESLKEVFEPEYLNAFGNPLITFLDQERVLRMAEKGIPVPTAEALVSVKLRSEEVFSPDSPQEKTEQFLLDVRIVDVKTGDTIGEATTATDVESADLTELCRKAAEALRLAANAPPP